MSDPRAPLSRRDLLTGAAAAAAAAVTVTPARLLASIIAP
jgi:hypothetical protein